MFKVNKRLQEALNLSLEKKIEEPMIDKIEINNGKLSICLITGEKIQKNEKN